MKTIVELQDSIKGITMSLRHVPSSIAPIFAGDWYKEPWNGWA